MSENEPNSYFKGDISKVMLWNRALSGDEIKNLVNETPQDNLKLHYEFEDGKAKDLSDNNYDGISHLTEKLSLIHI